MTPKEKAFELAHKFRLIDIRTSESTTMMISMTDAKQCALIAVDEIMNVIIGSYDYELEKQYWEEVKQEIEKL
jgi:flagellar assembly factor FliW